MSEEENLNIDDLEEVQEAEPSPEPVKKKVPVKQAKPVLAVAAAGKSKTKPAVPVSASSGKASPDADKQIAKVAKGISPEKKVATKKEGPAVPAVKQEVPYTTNGELIETELPPTLAIPKAFYKVRETNFVRVCDP